MVLLLCMSFFFSGSETALFSLTKEELHRFKEHGGRWGAMVCSLLSDPKDLLITVLFGNMVVNVLFFSFSFDFFLQTGNRLIESLGGLAALLTVLVFGEVLPKAVAVTAPYHAARFVAPPLTVLKKAAFPIRLVIGAMIGAVTGVVGHPPAEEKYITAEELKMLLSLSQKAGVVDRRAWTMINEVVEFGEIRVKEVMTPRVDMTLFRLPGAPEEFRELVRRTRHSKIPVYKERIDNIIGVIHSKDVFLKPNEPLEGLVRPIQFVPESQSVESLLRQFREQKGRLAMVVDEYGGIEGMVTMEDILEEIVGEIWDEFDDRETPVEVTDDGRYLLSGDLNLRDWASLFGDDATLPGVTTLGGFITHLLGHVPHEGEAVPYKNLFFTVKKVRHRRVAQVALQLRDEKTEAGASTP